jgi:hypothetical protein
MAEITVDANFQDNSGLVSILEEFNVGVPIYISQGLDHIWPELEGRGYVSPEDRMNVTLSGTSTQIHQNNRVEDHMNEWIQILVKGDNKKIAIKFQYRPVSDIRT